MARELVWMTRPRQRLTGDQLIDPEYPRAYTPEQMRAWADDAARLRTVRPAELERWRTLPRSELTRDETRMLDSSQHLLDPNEGIKGDLRPDGIVDLQGGRHRAAYLMEQGVDPVPVWVSNQDAARVTALREQCERELVGRERSREQPPAGRSSRGSQPDQRNEQRER